MHSTYSIEETKELSLSLYSDIMRVNIGKRLSLYSDKHGGVKVKFLILTKWKPQQSEKGSKTKQYGVAICKNNCIRAEQTS